MNEQKENCTLFTVQPVSLAMAYVPLQSWRNIYEPAAALERGTLFAELDKPFLGREVAKK